MSLLDKALDWVTGGPPLFRSALLQPEQKLTGLIGGYEAALTVQSSGMLIHGPGAAAILEAPSRCDGNSAVFACLMALSMAYIEAPLRVYRRTGPGKQEEVTDHPLQAFLDNPNPVFSMLELRSWLAWAKHLDGNAYFRKIRAGNKRTGNVVELWPLSPTRVEIRSDGGQFISGYRWHWEPGKYDDIPSENILHYRLGLDDRDPRRGLAPFKRFLREVTSDQRATEWLDNLLGNFAMPGMLVRVKRQLTPEQAAQVKTNAQALFGGAHMGEVGVVDNDGDVAAFGFNPEQMQLDALHRVPEERIAAVLRVPPSVAGLGAGLDRSIYNNVRQAEESFTERTIIPHWVMDASIWQARLKPDFASDARILIAHDLTEVRALQEDRNSQAERLQRAVGGPYMTPNEARSDQGLPPLAGAIGNSLLLPIAVTPTPVEGDLPAPAPAAPPIPIRQAAGRFDAEHKAADPATVTDADLAASRARWRAVAPEGLADLLDATVVVNGNGQH